MKVSTDTLDGIIEKVSKVRTGGCVCDATVSIQCYSRELASFLRLLLRINHHQRPTAMYVISVCVCIFHDHTTLSQGATRELICIGLSGSI